MAAISALKNNHEVWLYEKNPILLKKLLITVREDVI